MRWLILILFLSCFIPAKAQDHFNYQKDFKTILKRSKDPSDKFYYDKLLAKFNSNDTSMTDMEVIALMIGFTDKPQYKPYDDLSTERMIYDLNGDGKFKEALDSSARFLKTHPLSQQTLIERSYAWFKLGSKDSADIYMFRFRRIMRAMNWSGAGTFEDPIFALGPADGQNFIYKFLSGNIGMMGDGRDKDGNFLDILEVKFKNGDSKKLYFNIQRSEEHTSELQSHSFI